MKLYKIETDLGVCSKCISKSGFQNKAIISVMLPCKQCGIKPYLHFCKECLLECFSFTGPDNLEMLIEEKPKRSRKTKKVPD